MPVVFIPKPMRDMTGGMTQVTVEGRTVREVVDALDQPVIQASSSVSAGAMPSRRGSRFPSTM